MPSTVQSLFDKTNLALADKIKWGKPIPCNSPGVYVVSTSPHYDRNEGSLLKKAPLDNIKIQEWINRVPKLTIDGEEPSVEAIHKRLYQFWLPDESIIYIGRAKTSLRTRSGQYQNTPLGDDSPHSGGHWIKTLSNIDDLSIYWACTPDPIDKEIDLIDAFIENVSLRTRSSLYDPARPFPFANLKYSEKKKYPGGKIKIHGLAHQVNR